MASANVHADNGFGWTDSCRHVRVYDGKSGQDALVMMLWARSSDRGAERSWFVGSALVVGALALIVCGYATSSTLISIIGVIRQSTDNVSRALISVPGFLTMAAILIRVVGLTLQRRVGADESRTSPTGSLSMGILR